MVYEMNWVQILAEATYISLNTFGKGMNLSLLLPAISKL